MDAMAEYTTMDVMSEDFVVVLNQEWHRTDLKALTKKIGEHEFTMRLKRRWLMDLPLSKPEQKRIDELLPPNDMILPESFLREDDVGHEDIRSCIEKAFGAPNSQEDPICEKPFGASNSQEEPICDRADVTVFNSSDGFQEVSFLLDAMTNKGLCSFARILTGGLDIFDKTKWGMMRTIKELLPKVIADKNDVSRTKLKRCSLLLRDPSNFRGNETMHFTASESYCAAAFKVLEGLEDFSSRTIHAMLRKLKSVKGYTPSLKTPRIGHLGSLIKAVRKKCTAMLSNIGVDEPAEELSGALEVASLTLKLIMNRPGVRDFRRFSPEVVALHNDIAKAIHSLNDPKKVCMITLKKLQLLLDPNIVLSAKGLRKAVKNLLIDYLYECSDMENVPSILIETLDIINTRAQLGSGKKSSSKGFSSSKKWMKEEIEKEMQYLLNISAQAKEVVVNLLPEHEFDEEFARAYMEDIDGSSGAHCVFDDDLQMEDNSEHFKFHSYSSCDQTESIGETNPVELNSPVPTSKRNSCLPPSPNGRSDMTPESMHLHSPAYEDSKLQNSQCLGFKAEEFEPACSDSMKLTTKPSMSHARKSSHNEIKCEETTSCSAKTGFSDIKAEETDIVDQQSRSVNGYLELQETCDATSMVAYRFVGFMLDTLAKTENLELDQGDRLYLRSHASVVQDTQEFSDVVMSKFSKMWKNVLEH